MRTRGQLPLQRNGRRRSGSSVPIVWKSAGLELRVTEMLGRGGGSPRSSDGKRGRPARQAAGPDGAAGGGSAATRGPDGVGPRCDGMAAGGSRGHAQAVPQFSMPVSCRGQLLAGGQTASECSDGKRDRHGPRPARDREWVGPLAAGGRKCGPGGSYHCSGMDAAGVAAVCQSYGSQRD